MDGVALHIFLLILRTLYKEYLSSKQFVHTSTHDNLGHHMSIRIMNSRVSHKRQRAEYLPKLNHAIHSTSII